ncbi:phosphoribosylamine--glycine ligase [Labrys sp. LIt4]|uniref:Phosphoribosylamine--glycine ligase n=1 Tax=Labrys okinawensis TaxID=346911 RepID=A0A2S9QEN9_9HYPH|nr:MULTISPECIES: phosphoribosylamine--glycine ligase [Labrys]MBP0578056.1 phosphoribosylamine--glycine ligase [Labrys sp. LIt4]PRH87821.1 phosphoribosylamine--glycine ligase [Labrys okinawensis]
MNILLIGSGGREHALAWAISASPLCERLYAAPGNPGMEECAICAAVDATDHPAVIAFCRENEIDFVVVGPEAPLVAGLVDDLAAAGIKAFGPSRAAAQLEGSKGYTKDLCQEFSIPTAAYRRFTDAAAARAYVREQGAPIVIKADGLAAGKGVVVAMTLEDALAAVDAIFAGSVGEAGHEVVVEQFLEGEEASFFALCDGTTAIPLISAQDHKRAFDGDKGPNTGGMGAYSPAPIMTPEMEERVMETIIRPTVRAMAARGTPFKGVLFAGLMITRDGPQLIEYNVRFGDPETQVLMPRLRSDLLPALIASADGVLSTISLRWKSDAALCVVMATKGYPGSFPRGSEIRDLAKAASLDDVLVFHAGTKRSGDHILANGGRVLGITASGKSVAEAQKRAYEAVDLIDWPEGFSRRDIGWRAIGKA